MFFDGRFGEVACVNPCKAHGSMSLYDDTRTAISARLQRKPTV